MNTAEIIILCLTGISLLINANQHGKTKKESTHDFWTSLVSNALMLALMYWAGLFHLRP